MKKNRIKDFWSDYKYVIVVGGVLVTAVAINTLYRNTVVTNEFLKEKDLFDEFYGK